MLVTITAMAMETDDDAFTQQLDRLQQDFTHLFSALDSFPLSQAQFVEYKKDSNMKECSFKMPKWSFKK